MFHPEAAIFRNVIAGLDPAIHPSEKRWMRGSSPRMTTEKSVERRKPRDR
jgi:hypothetical protein